MSSDSLLQRVTAFLKTANMPVSIFGREAVRDPGLVGDLRKGREAGPEIVERVDAFMARWMADYRSGKVQPVGDRRFRAP